MQNIKRIVLMTLALLLFAVTVFAAMYIHTRDGRVIEIPVNKEDVLNITYSANNGMTGRSGEPWVVNSNGNIYRRQGNSWQLLPGLAKDIGVGANGAVWVIGTNGVGGGYGIYHWNGSNWDGIDGGAVRIAVAPNGEPWVVNSNGNIYRRQGNSWQQMPGLAVDIGIGANGAVWVIGTNGVGGGYGIYHWNGSNWDGIDGGAVRIAVAPNGEPWVVNSNGNIYRRQGNSWQQMPGLAKDIGVGADGGVWVIGTNGVGGGYGIYNWNGSNWDAIDGGAVEISVR